jgi:ATP-binding protein involved in chromosome partitioning
MASLEQQFEQAFTEIVLPGTSKHLLDAEAVTGCVVQGGAVTVTLALPKDAAVRQKVGDLVRAKVAAIPGITSVSIRMEGDPDPHAGHDHAGHDHGAHDHAEHDHGADDHAGHDHAGHDHGADDHGHAHGQHSPEPTAGSQPRQPQRPKRNTYLGNYEAVVAVGSGKGGVGKSTVAVNLAIALASLGYKTSLFDADIYGPSLPIMMGLRNTRPKMEGENALLPLNKYGIDCMSIGNLVDEAAATIWRGPIVHQVIEQLLRDTRWPGGDFMIIDLPPGTGDTHLTLTQLCELAGSVIVSTPQDVALLDAMKAVAMFQKVEVPVLGLVENMSSFICPKCSTETPIFDKGNAERAASQSNIPFLGRVPIELAIRVGGDLGKPIVATQKDSASAQAFMTIAKNLIGELEAAE